MSSSYETESEILAGLGKDTEDDSVNAVPQIVLGVTVVCIKVHKIVSVWCKIALGEVGVSLP